MGSLAGSLGYGVLAHPTLISLGTPIPPTNLRREGALEKSTETLNTKTIYCVLDEKMGYRVS